MRYHKNIRYFFTVTALFMVLIMVAVDNGLALGADLPDGNTSNVFLTNSIGIDFVKIPKGFVKMGSPVDEQERDSDERQYGAIISHPLYLQTTEITVGQWRQFVDETEYKTEGEKEGWSWIWNGETWEKKEGCCWYNPGYTQDDSFPVTCVSWNDTQFFLRWLNIKEGRIQKQLLRTVVTKETYRLPTEAEWEYACRAGTVTPFFTGNCITTEAANYDGRYPMPECVKGIFRKGPVSVASFSPNPWGFYDMHGNVWEWCQDWYGNYPTDYETDPLGPNNGKDKVMRGGGWHNTARFLRSADRSKGFSRVRTNYLGFRISLETFE